MNRISISSSHSYNSEILVGESLLSLPSYLPHENVVLIVDEVVAHLYEQQLEPYTILTVGASEKNKSLATIDRLAMKLLALGASRSTFLVGVGGGITCDIVGFLASIYMRGLRFGLVPTTLLAQLDASVGGKNGVNLQGYKNMLGVFNQPDFVLCDLHMLSTLPQREFRAGLAELVKAALIADSRLFEQLEASAAGFTSLSVELLNDFVYRAVGIKSAIVQRDERELGERRKLNLGHTFAHAIEKHASLNHGEAVSIGLVIAAQLSCKLGLLSMRDVKRIEGLLVSLGLPTTTDLSADLLLDAIAKDKKRQNDSIHFVFMDGIGSVKTQLIPLKELALML